MDVLLFIKMYYFICFNLLGKMPELNVFYMFYTSYIVSQDILEFHHNLLIICLIISYTVTG
jgi:hypothetical protein